MTVTTTVSSRELAPLVQVDGADGDDLVAVDRARRRRRRRAPGRRRRRRPGPTSAPLRRHGRLQVLRVGRPAAGVDVGAVGLGVDHRRPRRRGGAGPRGRSRTPPRWRSRPRPAARRAGGPRARRRGGSRTRRHATAVDDHGADVGADRARSSGSRRGRRADPGQLGLEPLPRCRRPACGRPAAKSLMPLSANGLCDAEIIAAGTIAAPPRRTPRRAWAARRGRRRRRPRTPARRPAPRSSIGPDCRVSRPISHRALAGPASAAAPAPRLRPRPGPARRSARCWRRRGRRRCRTWRTSGSRHEPIRAGCRRARPRISAWSTAEPCGPS